MVVMDGKQHVVFEKSLTLPESEFIKEQSITRIDVPMMTVNLEERFPGRCYSKNLLHRLREKHLKQKYGPDGHHLPDLFAKGHLIRDLGGIFAVVPSSEDFGIKTIHCQTKLMRQYADVYATDGFRMADGTHKISQYDWTFVFWIVVDCLFRSKFVGYSANFTENSEAIIEGGKLFFQTTANDPIRVGGISGHFDPFVDREIDISQNPQGQKSCVDSTCDSYATSAKSDSDIFVRDTRVTPDNKMVPTTQEQESSRSVTKENSMPASKMEAFMTDEGSAFPLVAKHFNWRHLLDRKHFSLQIKASWHGLADPNEYQSDIYRIMDCSDVSKVDRLLSQALSTYQTEKAQKFLTKLSDHKEKLCYAYTSDFFTAGHVSDQRSEGGMSATKAREKLRSYLSKCTYGEAVSRISQVAREQDLKSLDELVRCRHKGMKLGERYTAAMLNVKALALKLSSVEQMTTGHQYQVKESSSSKKECIVNIAAVIRWRGVSYNMVTGTCSYFKSTRQLCPCACAAMQRLNMDIDAIQNHHPFYHLWFHPLWKQALEVCGLDDYDDSPFHNVPKPVEASSEGSLSIPDIIRRENTRIFDNMKDLGNLNESGRIMKLRQTLLPLEKVAAKSMSRTKVAIASITELTNRLGSVSLTDVNSCAKPTAIFRALGRHSKHMLENKSPLNYSGSKKGNSKSRVVGRKKKRGCTRCRDIFDMPESVYTTHRADSKYCPTLLNVSKVEEEGAEVQGPTNITSLVEQSTVPSAKRAWESIATELSAETAKLAGEAMVTTMALTHGFAKARNTPLCGDMQLDSEEEQDNQCDELERLQIESEMKTAALREKVAEVGPPVPKSWNPMIVSQDGSEMNEDSNSDNILVVDQVEGRADDRVSKAISMLKAHGNVIDVSGDGSCGYHALLLILEFFGKINTGPTKVSMYNFRKEILEFSERNQGRILGKKPDGSDGAFLIKKTGESGFKLAIKRSHTDPFAVQQKLFKTTITKGIWKEGVDYSGIVGSEHWMNARFVLPLVTFQYRIKELVLYTMTSGVFFTSIYTFDDQRECIYIDEQRGLNTDVDSTSMKMLYFHDMKHYQVLEPLRACQKLKVPK